MNRRSFLKASSLAIGSLVAHRAFGAQEPATQPASGSMLMRAIPSTGEKIPAVGMGTSRTFAPKEAQDPKVLAPLEEVLKMFHASGGRLVDSAATYGTAEEVTGKLAKKLGITNDLFLATKVRTTGKEAGIKQMEESFAKFGREKIDLMQVHNLVDWETQLPTVQEWKKNGKFRYTGITFMRPDAYDAAEKLMKDKQIDFVQIPYSAENRDVEKRILPAAKDNGIAILTMTPLGGGRLIKKWQGKPLPDAVKGYASSWSQALLKWILANETVTCIIPATSKPDHMKDNLQAGFGRLPSAAERDELVKLLES